MKAIVAGNKNYRCLVEENFYGFYISRSPFAPPGTLQWVIRTSRSEKCPSASLHRHVVLNTKPPFT